jgi:ribonuclease-3 family protein
MTDGGTSSVSTFDITYPPCLHQPMTRQQIAEVPTSALAYLGDAVYELYVRLHYLMPPKTPKGYHRAVTAQVRAEQQAAFLDTLDLTPEEQEVVRRGRNAAGPPSRRLAPEIYQRATGLETLVGYLYLSNPERLTQILDQLLGQLISPSSSDYIGE